MKRISFGLIAILTLALAPLALADVIPDGMESIGGCDKVSNLEAFPDYSLIVVSDSIMSGKISVLSIKPLECVPTFYKFDTTKSFAIRNSDFPSSDFSGIKGLDDARLIPLNLQFAGGFSYVKTPNSIKDVSSVFTIKSIDPKIANLYKSQEITTTKDGYSTTKSFDESGKEVTNPLSGPFSDVPLSHPFVDGIAYLKSEGYVQGYPDGTYKPDQTINRAEFVKILLGFRHTSAEMEQCLMKNVRPEWSYVFFPDVPKTEWFSPFICMAKMGDVIKGYPDGNFRPTATINMAEAYKIVLTTLVGPFTYDAKTQVAWYTPYFDYALKNGLSLYPILDPAKAVTRGEMAELIRKVESR